MKRVGAPLPLERAYLRPRIEEQPVQALRDPQNLPVEIFFSLFENHGLVQIDYHAAFLVSKGWSDSLTTIMSSKRARFKANIFSQEVERIQKVSTSLLLRQGRSFNRWTNHSPNRQRYQTDLHNLLEEIKQVSDNQTQAKMEWHLHRLLTHALKFHLFTEGGGLDFLLDLCRSWTVPLCFLRETSPPIIIDNLFKLLIKEGRIENAFPLLEVYQLHLGYFHQRFFPTNVFDSDFIPLFAFSTLFEPLGWQKSLEVTCNIAHVKMRHWVLVEWIKFSHQHIQPLQPEEKMQETQEWIVALGTRLIQMRDIEKGQYKVELEQVFVSKASALIKDLKTKENEQVIASLVDYLAHHFSHLIEPHPPYLS